MIKLLVLFGDSGMLFEFKIMLLVLLGLYGSG